MNVMITLNSIQKHGQDIHQLSQQYHVANPRVFGSVLHGEQSVTSDVDILVDATEETTLFDMGGFQQALMALLNTPVDVVTPEDLSVDFREQVLSSAQAV